MERARQKTASAVVGTASAVAQKFASAVFLPALPAIAVSFSLDHGVAKQAVPAMLIGIALSQFIWGRVSDHIGRRRVLFILLPIYVGGASVSATAPAFPIFLLGLFLQGFAVGAIFSVSQALVGSVIGRKEAARMLALIALLASWASATGAMLGGFLVDHLDWRLSFVFLAAFVLGVGGLYFLLPPDERGPPSGRLSLGKFFGGYGVLLRKGEYLKYALVVAWLNVGLFVFLTVSPFIVIADWGLAAHEYGLLMFIPFSGLAVGRFVCRYLSGRMDTDQLISVGGAISLVGGVVLVGVRELGVFTPWTLMCSMAIYLIGLGVAAPGARAKAMYVVAGLIGSGASLLSVTVNLLGALGSSLAGHLPDTALGLLIVGAAGINMILFRWMRSRTAVGPPGRA